MKAKLYPILFLLAAGCSKDNTSCTITTETAPATEVEALQTYLDKNNIQATKSAHGFFYVIDDRGSGAYPNGCSEVTVNYRGSLANGSVFDTASNITLPISGLMAGWQQGLALLKKGGRITLYIPPTLAYGDQATSGIPANSILIYSIELLDVAQAKD
ncbi:MAG: FKBP-type peptidyl-prolyl cis-trans isomerase [Edaphocola sp.]